MKRPVPKYILAKNYIKQAIKDHKFRDKLPGERTLADQLGFSYMTVRKAVDNLTAEGILYKIPTKGSFVNNENRGAKRTKTIGYFLDSGIESGISSPYYSLIFNAIEKEAAKNDYSVTYFSDVDENRLCKILLKLDGVIATCFPRVEDAIMEMKLRVPVVVIDNSSKDKTIPSVVIDNFNADVEAVDYICSLGHKRIGFITGLEDSSIGKHRYAGYFYGLNKNSIKLDKSLIYRGNYSYEAGTSGAKYFISLDELPTAIICANDSMALGAIKKLKQEGFNIPEDISIVGFDNIEVASQIVPALTTIVAPIDKIAKSAFDMLEGLIQGKKPEYRHITLAASLAIRESCTRLIKKAVV
ncbi:MAG: GntR family transcriptional regulator [Nitrospinota bacterium]